MAQTATVSGIVTDDGNNPLQDVNVVTADGKSNPAITDADGKYQIVIEAGKEVELHFINLSYKTFSKKIQAKPHEKIKLSPHLVFKNEIEDVTVISENRKQEDIYIQSKDYFKLAGPTPDISKILLAQGLGVQSSNELSSSYSVRGGSFDENLVYVNDVEVFRPFLAGTGQQMGLSFPNPDMVSSLHFSSGGFEAKYGDKMSSVLDVQYRKPRNFGASVQGGLLGGSVSVENCTKNKLFSWQVGARYRNTQYVLKAMDTKGEYKPSFYDVQAHLTFDISEKLTLEYLGMISDNKYLVIPANRKTTFGTFQNALSFDVYFDGQEISNYQTYFSALSATYKPKDSLSLKFIASGYRDNEDQTFTIQGQYYINQLNNDFGSASFGNTAYNLGVGTYLNNGRDYLHANVFILEHKGKYQKKRHTFLWGLRGQEEIISNKMNEWNYLDSAGYSVPQSPTAINLPYVLKSQVNVQSARIMEYAEYVWDKPLKDTSNLTLSAGIRSNYWTLNQQNVLSPRVTAAYMPHWKRNWVFRASWGYYYQPPFFREMLNLQGQINTNLKAQESIHYVLSGDVDFKMWRRPFKFMGALYYKQMKNLVPYDINNVLIRYYGTNNSQGYATGIDMRLNGEFIKGVESWISLSVMHTAEKIQGLGYYTYTDQTGQAFYPGLSVTTKTDSVYHTKGYIPRPTDQLVTLNMFFQDHLPKLPAFKMGLNFIFGTGLPITILGRKDLMANNFRYPSYKRVDINFTYDFIREEKPLSKNNPFHFIRSAWLGLEVMNLLGINNTVSYTWINSVSGVSYGVPNYLTNRQVNVKLQIKF
ncbi:MAG: carboxypeptidase-like regulatory domain-containing protein [Bacteroidetes bacterium]|nr:carboxypeptidase-like regulatory domain-containing protein [Bacteroidota bacterium]